MIPASTESHLFMNASSRSSSVPLVKRSLDNRINSIILKVVSPVMFGRRCSYNIHRICRLTRRFDSECIRSVSILIFAFSGGEVTHCLNAALNSFSRFPYLHGADNES